MRILFGRKLDGQHSRRPVNAAGLMTLGPEGFLRVLELYLGLGRNHAPEMLRIIEYRKILLRIDDGKRFYSRSFRVDDLGVAAALLSWRDGLCLEGWDGLVQVPASSPRLADLGEAEAAMRNERFPPGRGERLRAVAEALDYLSVPVDSVELLEPLAWHPLRWQTVLGLLGRTGELKTFGAPAASRNTALHALQHALLTGEKPLREPDWDRDDSVTLLAADTALAAAHHTAGVLAASRGSTLLVSGGEGELLDDVLAGTGLPRQGLQERSSGRLPYQLLPLAVRLRWNPLDVHALLDFLALPDEVNPVHPGLRSLAGVVAEHPGIGGFRWRRAVEAFLSREGPGAAVHTLSFESWIADRTASRQAGIGTAELRAIAGKVREFFLGRRKEQKGEAGGMPEAGIEQAEVFLDALESLERQGIDRLSPYQLDQLLAFASMQGGLNPDLFREAGAVCTATDPEAVCEHSVHVVWWWAAAPAFPQGSVWTRPERSWLERQGVRVPDVQDELARQAESWKRPVLAAEERLTLVLPSGDAEKHPLWLTISALFPGLPILRAETVLGDTGASAGRVQVQHRALVRYKPFWELPRGIALPSHPFSPTSLERFLSNPVEWVLAYAARLAPTKMLEVSDGPKLYGLLAHRIVQELTHAAGGTGIDAGSLDIWYDREFSRLVAEEGATLLMPGKAAELEGVRSSMRGAVRELVAVLNRKGVGRIESECRLSGVFDGGELTGCADLLLTDRIGRRFLIDMKWGGEERYRRSMAQGTHLQLIVYAALVRQRTGLWPATAYYILSRAQLLAERSGDFEGCRGVRGGSDETVEALWERFLVTFRWRMGQLGSGRIEVAPETQDPYRDAAWPSGGLRTLRPGRNRDPYRTLEGWGEEQ
jgi:hypothetical protein